MEIILELITKNYSYILIAFIIVFLAIIGYVVEKKRGQDVILSKKKSKIQEIMELTENEEISEESMQAIKNKTFSNIQQQNQDNVENL